MNFWLIKLRYGLAIHVDKVVTYMYIFDFQTELFVYDLSRKKYKKQARNYTIYWRWVNWIFCVT